MSNEPWSVSGYLEVDGVRRPIKEATQEIERDNWQRASAVLITGKDEDDRPLNIYGKARNHIGKQASPGYFAWMSMFEWDFAGGALGEFQDVWSPDRLSLQASNRFFS